MQGGVGAGEMITTMKQCVQNRVSWEIMAQYINLQHSQKSDTGTKQGTVYAG